MYFLQVGWPQRFWLTPQRNSAGDADDGEGDAEAEAEAEAEAPPAKKAKKTPARSQPVMDPRKIMNSAVQGHAPLDSKPKGNKRKKKAASEDEESGGDEESLGSKGQKRGLGCQCRGMGLKF